MIDYTEVFYNFMDDPDCMSTKFSDDIVEGQTFGKWFAKIETMTTYSHTPVIMLYRANYAADDHVPQAFNFAGIWHNDQLYADFANNIALKPPSLQEYHETQYKILVKDQLREYTPWLEDQAATKYRALNQGDKMVIKDAAQHDFVMGRNTQYLSMKYYLDYAQSAESGAPLYDILIDGEKLAEDIRKRFVEEKEWFLKQLLLKQFFYNEQMERLRQDTPPDLLAAKRIYPVIPAGARKLSVFLLIEGEHFEFHVPAHLFKDGDWKFPTEAIYPTAIRKEIERALSKRPRFKKYFFTSDIEIIRYYKETIYDKEDNADE